MVYYITLHYIVSYYFICNKSIHVGSNTLQRHEFLRLPRTTSTPEWAQGGFITARAGGIWDPFDDLQMIDCCDSWVAARQKCFGSCKLCKPEKQQQRYQRLQPLCWVRLVGSREKLAQHSYRADKWSAVVHGKVAVQLQPQNRCFSALQSSKNPSWQIQQFFFCSGILQPYSPLLSRRVALRTDGLQVA